MSKQKNNIPVGLRLDSTNEGMMTSRRKALAMIPILRERDKINAVISASAEVRKKIEAIISARKKPKGGEK